MDLVSTGKFLSLILRHRPESVGISWMNTDRRDVEELIAGVWKTRPEFSMEALEEIFRKQQSPVRVQR